MTEQVKKILEQLNQRFKELLNLTAKEIEEATQQIEAGISKKVSQLKKSLKEEPKKEEKKKEEVAKVEEVELESMEDALKLMDNIKKFKKGQIVEAKVISKSDGVAFVELAPGVDGKINEDLEVEVGEKVRALIVSRDEDDTWILSVEKVDAKEGWEELKKIYEREEPVEVKITSKLEKGYIAKRRGVEIFIPMSQLVDKELKIGDKINVLIIELKPRKKSAVASQKRLLGRIKKQVIAKLRKEEPAKLKAKVKEITDKGVVVQLLDYDNVEAFIPLGELKHGKTINVRNVVKEGEELEVALKEINDKNNIIVSRKILLPDPWEKLDIKVDDELDAVVIQVNKNGCLVEIKEGVVGLIRLSELDWQYVENPNEVVKEGDKVKVKVLELDKENKRLLLSRKALMKDPWIEFSQKVKEGDTVKGKVSQVQESRYVIDFDNSVVGFLYKNDVDWKANKDWNKVLEVGKEYDFYVLSVDPEARKILLSLKHLKKEPWQQFIEKVKEGDIVKGRIKLIKDFGAIVEVEGNDCLLPANEIVWSSEKINPKDYLKEGEEIEVKVVSIDKENKKVKLSKKALEENPFEKLLAEVKEGEKIEVTVKNKNKGGVVALYKDKLEVFIPNREIAWSNYLNAKKGINEDSKIEVIVLEKRDNKLLASIRKLDGDLIDMLKKYIDKIIDVEFVRKVRNGFLVRWKEKVDGVVDPSEESYFEGIEAGEEIQVKLLEVDEDRAKFKASYKEALEEIKKHGEDVEEDSVLKEQLEQVLMQQVEEKRKEKTTKNKAGGRKNGKRSKKR